MTALDVHKHGFARLIGPEGDLREIAKTLDRDTHRAPTGYEVFLAVVMERARADALAEPETSDGVNSVTIDLVGIYHSGVVTLFHGTPDGTFAASYMVDRDEGVPILSGEPRPIVGEEIAVVTSAMTHLANRGYSVAA